MSFWSLNIGLAWMSFATLFPLGILQLYESVNNGYYEARTLEFLTNETNALIEWMRLPGRRALHRRRRAAAPLPLLARRAPHRPARHDGGAGGHPVHRDHRARADRAAGAIGHPRRGLSRGRLRALFARVAVGLDLLARHSHARSERYRTAGFTYHAHPTPGSAPRASSSGVTSTTTSAGSFATEASRRSAMRAPRSRTAPTRTRGERSCARSTSGPATRLGRFHWGLRADARPLSQRCSSPSRSSGTALRSSCSCSDSC